MSSDFYFPEDSEKLNLLAISCLIARPQIFDEVKNTWGFASAKDIVRKYQSGRESEKNGVL